ncbi:PREDICTED: uncharacterized protein LOC101300739 isoform X2 [Fragaria vesca subsp. vesca]|uniref:uncharacterized protein LOC101300739 isoform X2 n=1 Tax=Fragaria vesca subsp. vesca TaxID=101020 RepID=UPI0002C376B1|nr:PREDICTED: uncharacterized protein LOC101300739 isoform X2 [Fragaria vesca subsp. vesca]
MSRSSDPVDPLLGFTLFPTAKVSSDLSNPYDFDRELHAINLHLNSSMASRSGLKDQAKNILSGSSAIQQSDYSEALKRLNEVVPANVVENHRERRQALRCKRPRFSLKPNPSQPDISLESTFDSKKYKNPEEYFMIYERNENAKRELEKQMGGAIFDGDKQNPSSITRARRPGIPRRSVKYKHRISLLENEIMESAISTQETFETSILSPLSHSAQTESHEKVDLEEMDLAGSEVKEDNNRNNDILDGLLSQPTEELEGDGALRRLKESFNVKTFELEDICLPEFPDIQMADFKSSRRTLPNPRPVKPKQGAERSIHLASPTTPKSLLASLSLLKRKRTSDELKSPLIKQNDKIESEKTGSCEVSNKEFTNAAKRSKRDSLSKPGVAYDVDMEEVGGSKVTSETFSMLEDDTSRENGFDNCDKVEEKLQEAGPEVTAEDSTLEMVNGVQSQVADDVIDSNKIREEDKEQEAMPEHNVADSTSEKCNRAPSRVADIVINYDGVQEQDKLQDSVACTEHGFDVAESTVEKLNAPSQLDSAPVEEHPRVSLSKNADVGLEEQNEIMQENSGVLLNKPTEANSRSRRKQKNKEVSKRQSLAGHGTSWNSGVRRSTRIRTRPLEYWKGERLLIGRVHNSLPTVIGMKYASPGKGEGKDSLKVKYFVDNDEHKVLVDLVSYH